MMLHAGHSGFGMYSRYLDIICSILSRNVRSLALLPVGNVWVCVCLLQDSFALPGSVLNAWYFIQITDSASSCFAVKLWVKRCLSIPAVNAPVTKAVVVAVIATTLFTSIIGVRDRFGIRADAVLFRYEAWRLLTHNFLFSTPGELLFGIVLLYYFRQFERQMGSSRFFAFVIVGFLMYTSLLIATDLLLPSQIFLSSGPYAFIFSAFVQFYFETPKIYEFQLFGAVPLSDKSFPYMLAIQLVVSGLPGSFFCFLCAIVTGGILRLPAISRNLQTPPALVSFASHRLLPLMDTAAATPPRSSRRRRERVVSNAAHPSAAGESISRRENAQSSHLNSTAPGGHDDDQNQPLEHQIGAITAIGFTREQAIEALAQTGNDVQRAAERLLTS